MAKKKVYSILDTLRAYSDTTKVLLNMEQSRADAITTEFDGKNGEKIVIDSCYTADTRMWETAVMIDEASWKIAERYPDKAAAEVGHEKWRAALEADPTMEVPDVSLDSYGIEIDVDEEEEGEEES